MSSNFLWKIVIFSACSSTIASGLPQRNKIDGYGNDFYSGRLWKRCMQFTMKNSDGKLEKYFIDPRTGTAHKGSCSETFKTFLNEGTLTVSDKKGLDKIPDVPGLLSYRKDNKQLYVNQGSKWQALGNEQEVQQLQQKVKTQGKTIQTQEKIIEKMEKEHEEFKSSIAEFKSFIEQLDAPSWCTELRQRNSSLPSGIYNINLQRRSFTSTAKSVTVYCDMTSKNGVGVTVIGHDSESRTFVKGYESKGSYKRSIQYDLPMEQIDAIIERSKKCEQLIKYECYGSGFWFPSPDSWWVSRQGSPMDYWGGAAVGSEKCACGMTNSCAGGGKCNCDKNDYIWREDSGYLTDKNTLPVTKLRFGDTGYIREKGYHTLGKLRCWG